ncbi:MAG: RtcB family protein [Hyphomicrobiaceae bacterium]
MRSDLDVVLFANENVFIDSASVGEILSFAEIGGLLETLNGLGYFGDRPARLDRIVLTPDFHRGTGIPVGTVLDAYGFVLPKAVGSDIGCGMRLLATDVTAGEFARLDSRLDRTLRHIFFEGGRDIPLSPGQRRGLFTRGIQGLLDEPHAGEGIWRLWDTQEQESDLMRTHRLGRLDTAGVFALDDLIAGSGNGFSHDSQIGSIGGGNHFVEIQRIDEVFDGATARFWGLSKDRIAIMAHSGSVGIGRMVGNRFSAQAKAAFPRTQRHPAHGFYPLPADSELGRRYLSAMGNAGNFAYANRLFLGLMAVRALSQALGREIQTRLVYDAPHNLIWEEGDGRMIHRKGACPADGPSNDADFPFGHPVIVPGSMGSASYVLRGHGSVASLCSACHGAGRLAPRRSARQGSVQELETLRIVTKVDDKRLRRDVRAEWQRALLEEAPSRYKDVTPAIETVTGAGIASKVVSLWPLLTVKGI